MKRTIWHSGFFLILTGFVFFSFAGCGPVISKEIRDEISKGLTLRMVAKDPEAYKGETVLWSGLIISTLNLQEGTMIEVLQKPSDFQGKPKDVDDSEGRFLALISRYLDVAIYIQGRKVTVAGKIQGKKTQPLGEMEYIYPPNFCQGNLSLAGGERREILLSLSLLVVLPLPTSSVVVKQKH